MTLRLDPSAALECAWRYHDVPFSGFCSGRQRHRSRRGSRPGPRAPATPLPQHPRAELGEPLTRPHLREEEQGRLPPSPPGSRVSGRRGHRLAGWFPPDSCPAAVAGRSSWRVRTRVATPPAPGEGTRRSPHRRRRVACSHRVGCHRRCVEARARSLTHGHSQPPDEGRGQGPGRNGWTAVRTAALVATGRRR